MGCGFAGVSSGFASKIARTRPRESPAICDASLMNMSFAMAVGMTAEKMA